MSRQKDIVPAGSSIQSPAAWRPWLYALATLPILGVVVWIVYGRAVDAPFIFDDVPSVVENPSIVSLWPFVDSDKLGPLQPPQYFPTAGRPLVNLSLAVNYHFGGLQPRGYHLFNMALHMLSAALLAAIVRRTLLLPYLGGQYDRAAWPLSLMVAVIWAVHPLQTEAVQYVTQRTELMVSFFYLATLYCSLRYWEAAGREVRNSWLVLATLACLAGMASKEVMVTAPIVVLLFERTFVAGTFRQALRRSRPLYAGLALGWVLLIALNYDGPRGSTAGFSNGPPAGVWWLTQASVLMMYLKLVFWPSPLVIHYGFPYLESFAEAWLWVGLAALLAAATIYLVWRRLAVGFVAACVWLILSPTLGVPINTEVAAERRMYLPLAAIVALVVVGGYALLDRVIQRSSADPKEARRRSAKDKPAANRWTTPLFGAAAATLALAVLLILASARRVEAYSAPVILWQEAAAHQANDHVIRGNLGQALIQAERPQDAIEHLERALELKPDYAEAAYNLGLAMEQTSRPQEAMDYYQRALRMRPNYPLAHNNLAIVLLKTGQAEQAIDHFHQAVNLSPNYVDARYNLGTALIAVGRPQEAIEHLEAAIRLQPENAAAQDNLGLALVRSGRAPEAIEYFQQALRLRPNFPDTHYNLGLALYDTGRKHEAMDHYRRAVRLKPDFAAAHNNLASAPSSDNRPREALDSIQRALLIQPDVPLFRFNLARALVQLNRGQEGLAAAQAALTLCRTQGQTALAAQIETWLKVNAPPTATPIAPGTAVPPP